MRSAQETAASEASYTLKNLIPSIRSSLQLPGFVEVIQHKLFTRQMSLILGGAELSPVFSLSVSHNLQVMFKFPRCELPDFASTIANFARTLSGSSTPFFEEGDSARMVVDFTAANHRSPLRDYFLTLDLVIRDFRQRKEALKSSLETDPSIINHIKSFIDAFCELCQKQQVLIHDFAELEEITLMQDLLRECATLYQNILAFNAELKKDLQPLFDFICEHSYALILAEKPTQKELYDHHVAEHKRLFWHPPSFDSFKSPRDSLRDQFMAFLLRFSDLKQVVKLIVEAQFEKEDAISYFCRMKWEPTSTEFKIFEIVLGVNTLEIIGLYHKIFQLDDALKHPFFSGYTRDWIERLLSKLDSSILSANPTNMTTVVFPKIERISEVVRNLRRIEEDFFRERPRDAPNEIRRIYEETRAQVPSVVLAEIEYDGDEPPKFLISLFDLIISADTIFYQYRTVLRHIHNLPEALQAAPKAELEKTLSLLCKAGVYKDPHPESSSLSRLERIYHALHRNTPSVNVALRNLNPSLQLSLIEAYMRERLGEKITKERAKEFDDELDALSVIEKHFQTEDKCIDSADLGTFFHSLSAKHEWLNICRESGSNREALARIDSEAVAQAHSEARGKDSRVLDPINRVCQQVVYFFLEPIERRTAFLRAYAQEIEATYSDPKKSLESLLINIRKLYQVLNFVMGSSHFALKYSGSNLALIEDQEEPRSAFRSFSLKTSLVSEEIRKKTRSACRNAFFRRAANALTDTQESERMKKTWLQLMLLEQMMRLAFSELEIHRDDKTYAPFFAHLQDRINAIFIRVSENPNLIEEEVAAAGESLKTGLSRVHTVKATVSGDIAYDSAGHKIFKPSEYIQKRIEALAKCENSEGASELNVVPCLVLRTRENSNK